jgi:uncharacterized protein (DUF486 family)
VRCRRCHLSEMPLSYFDNVGPGSKKLPMSAKVLPVALLLLSNVFMTFAWYGHLRFLSYPLWSAVLVSWGIAFFEYWLAEPANRIALCHPQLKTMQEVLTLLVFAVFSVVYLKKSFTWNYVIGFALIAAGAYFVLKSPF